MTQTPIPVRPWGPGGPAPCGEKHKLATPACAEVVGYAVPFAETASLFVGRIPTTTSQTASTASPKSTGVA